MKSNPVTFILIIVLVMVITIGAAFGSAADLTVRGGTIQAGEVHVLHFDENGVHTANWGLDTDTSMVDSICIGGFEEINYGNTIVIILTDIDHEELTRCEAIITDSEMCFTFNHKVDASDIFDLHVYLAGFIVQ
jgi:hypothetical protein